MCDKGKAVLVPIVKTLIKTANAPVPVAPYNQAVLADRTLYVSGVLGMDKDTNVLVQGGTVEEAKKALENLGNILEAGGSNFQSVVKVTIFLKQISDFAAVNDVYSQYFTRDYPARCAFQVAELPLNANIEIEAIALSGEVKIVGGSAGCTVCGPASCKCKM